ncbi:MAG: CoA ester lyase [Sulfolobaceae archaeon]
MQRMRRSQLYVPSISEKMIRKSLEIPADSIIFDLEDSVPPEEKQQAREILERMVKENEWKGKELAVRINPLYTSESLKDLLTIIKLEKIDLIIIPKAENDLSFIYKLTGKNILPIIETAKGLVRIEEIVRSEGIVGITYGIADYALSVGGEVRKYEYNEYIKTKIVSVARTYDIDPIDKVYFDLKNLEGFKNECIEAKKLGFEGKQVIHPSQVEIANQIFSLSEEEIKWAKEVVSAYEKAIREGRGAIRLNDQLIDAVHYRLAKRILNKYKIS